MVGAMLAGLAGAAWGEEWQTSLYFTYLHLLVVGWITQIIFGVAFWLFPRIWPRVSVVIRGR